MLAIKSNALFDVAMIPNVGAELTTSNRTTLGAQVYATFNMYGLDMKGVAVQPEFRYWPISGAMSKLYVGVSGIASHYNMSFKVSNYLGDQDIHYPGQSDRERFKGDAIGGGLTFGWVWPLTKYHWNIEAGASLGVIYYNHKHSYERDHQQNEAYNQEGLMFMPYNLGVTFSYIIHYRNEKDSKRHL